MVVVDEDYAPKAVLVARIKNLVELKKDDGVTDASFYIGYLQPPETIRELFTKYDTVITVGDAEPHDVTTIADTTHSYDRIHFHNMLYPIRCYCINKQGITAKKMIWQMLNEVWRVLRIPAGDPPGWSGLVKNWYVETGAAEEDHLEFSPPLICRRVTVRMLMVE